VKLRPIAKRWLYGSCPGFAGCFPYFGTRVFFPPQSVIFDRACREGIFEAQVLRMIWRLTRPGTTYLDIGANIGLMAVPVLATMPDVCVLSVEPSPATLPYLRQTVCHSKFQGRWRIIERAAADQVGAVEFFTSADCGGALDGLKDTGRSVEPKKVTVQSTTIDRVWVEQRTPEVSCLKIDVEGAELSVLNGAKNCIASQRPSIILEWNAENLAAYDCAPEALLHFAREMDLDVVAITPFSVIESDAMLRLAMKTCENFLLLPR
jgi:FkbM family methyltransferase